MRPRPIYKTWVSDEEPWEVQALDEFEAAKLYAAIYHDKDNYPYTKVNVMDSNGRRFRVDTWTKLKAIAESKWVPKEEALR